MVKADEEDFPLTEPEEEMTGNAGARGSLGGDELSTSGEEDRSWGAAEADLSLLGRGVAESADRGDGGAIAMTVR
jgi:hypothetical protein